MKLLWMIVSVCIALAPCAGAAGLAASSKPFGTRYIGEPGSPSPSLETNNTIENVNMIPGTLHSAMPSVLPAIQPAPQPKPVPAVPAAAPLAVYQPLPVVRPAFRPRVQAAAPETVNSGGDRRQYCLWDGLVEPLELPTDKVKGMTPDMAASLGRRDYDTHILSQAPVPAAARTEVRPELDRPDLVRFGEARGGGVMDGEVFVSMNMDLSKEPSGSLKDAVADLGRAAGFRQDPRFEPSAAGRGPGRVELWGWMPSNRTGDALTVPSVTGLAIHNKAVRAAQTGLSTDVLIGLRLPPGTAAVGKQACTDGACGISDAAGGGQALQAAAVAALARLEADLAIPGLRVKRGIGTQKAPGSGDTVLVVEASVPIAALSRIMAHRDVLKTVPAPPALAAAPERRPGFKDFVGYARKHSPLLLIFTLLLMLPAVGDFLLSAARVFIPYR